MAASLALAERHRQATRTIAGRLSAVLAALWARVDLSDAAGSWGTLLAEAEGAFVAAQLATAGMADGYVARSLAGQPGDRPDPVTLVAPEAFSGVAASGLDLGDLLAIPALRVSRSLTEGVDPRQARRAGGAALEMYAQTEVADAGRLSVQTAMATHHATGYVRHVGAFCCSRCAILSGRVYRFSTGFRRHPRCTCTMSPTSMDAEVPTPEQLYRQGRITDLTAAERRALDLGADMSQVVNARRGMFVAGGHEFTTTGTTRRGIAGARLLARSIARAGGAAPGGIYTNYTITRQEVASAVAKYGPLMKRGTPFQRHTAAGVQTAAYFRIPGRMSVAEIMRTSKSDDEIRRALLNSGYVTRRTSEIADRLRAS